MRIVLLLLSFLISVPTFAGQSERGTHADVSLYIAMQAEDQAMAAIHFKLDPHWHIYWKNPGDSGLAPSVTWQLPEGYSAGEILFPTPTRVNLSEVYSYAYEDEVTLLVPITPGDLAEDAMLEAKVDYLICKEICIPGSVMVSGTMQELTDFDRVTAAQEMLPESGAHLDITWSHNEGEVQIAVDMGEPITEARFWPFTEGIIVNSDSQRFDAQTGKIHVPAAKRLTEQPLEGVLEVVTEDRQTHVFEVIAAPIGAAVSTQAATSSESPEPASPSNSILLAIFLAFVGGLILNIMPCVLPVLSLKALSLVKKAESDPREVRREGILYTAGVLVSFAVLAGILIAFQQAGSAVGWGFQLQSPAFVTILIYILFLVGLNLSGVFDIAGSFTSFGSRAADRGGATGAFFTGVLATIVATPCTAPFMATALGVAFTQPPVISMLIFLSLGFGLAFPLLLISLVPAARRILPKPGMWMVWFKQFLAFPIYASVIWLLWVLVQQSGSMGLLLALSGLLLIAFLAWLIPLTGRAVTVIATVLVSLLIWQTVSRQQVVEASVISHESAQTFSQERVDQYRAEGKPVFVVGTASWCITCKVNEANALTDSDVQAHITENNIQYLVADWTNQNEPIRQYLASFGRNGVPIYVWYPPNGEPELLPQLLTPELVINRLQ